MGRPAQIPSDDVYNAIKEATFNIPQRDKESYGDYAKRICKYAKAENNQVQEISSKNMSRVMRSSNYNEYLELLHAEAHPHKEKNEEPDRDVNLLELIKRIDARLKKIESKLDQAEVKIMAYPNEDKLTRWDTLKRKNEEALNQ